MADIIDEVEEEVVEVVAEEAEAVAEFAEAKKTYENQLEYQANFDMLTNGANRNCKRANGKNAGVHDSDCSILFYSRESSHEANHCNGSDAGKNGSH